MPQRRCSVKTDCAQTARTSGTSRWPSIPSSTPRAFRMPGQVSSASAAFASSKLLPSVELAETWAGKSQRSPKAPYLVKWRLAAAPTTPSPASVMAPRTSQRFVRRACASPSTTLTTAIRPP